MKQFAIGLIITVFVVGAIVSITKFFQTKPENNDPDSTETKTPDPTDPNEEVSGWTILETFKKVFGKEEPNLNTEGSGGYGGDNEMPD